MHQFIDGERREGSSGNDMPILDPSTGRTIETIRLASVEDVDHAVAAARRSFPGWSRTTPAERSAILLRLSAVLDERAEELMKAESANAGKPIRLVQEFDVPGSIDNVNFFAGAARTLEGKATGEYSPDHTSSIRREAIGVIGSIAPWNYPFQMAVWKVLPAIAAGNTIVLKPSELTPLTTLMLADAAAEAGLPSGVLNVVTGTGRDVGEYLVGHPDVRMVSFTGSTAVGKSIAATAAQTVKRVHLELGGKAPFVVFDDADLDAAIHGAVAAALINSGQDCTAATRAYIQRPLYADFVAGVADLMSSMKLGPTDDLSTDQGPLISMEHRDRVTRKVQQAVQDGGKVLTGGKAPGGGLAAGSYFEPTLIVDADQKSNIMQEEVFGPVLAALPFDADDEAFALANDTPYGLASSAWTRNVYRALRATREIEAGAVWINDHIPIISEMPHGGYKGSGYGKDMSQYVLDEYTQIKHVMYDATGSSTRPWHPIVLGN
ncbi:1-pyrroline dehydrogenase [Nocardioides sp. J9]|uniref:gamma-aminobutyraldehyde dehydrogenase n=1 Tax=Nocardioides sp. J9 TaxID=935844 RepID=UPI0011A10545|nr:gamma-aminobutyraldehyde dehydrogenase [Nocardioides sp. J9]TWH01747.1 1-pyrroline dehydrogenase [Nocardioides sp. J9]